jgi:UMF1 family MFS transporter
MHALFRKELWTRELIAWYLYDFANSFVYINTTLYFSQWVVVDQGLTDFWYSLPFIIATVILILTSSAVGHFGDRTGRHFGVFFGASALAALSMLGMFFAGRFLPAGAGVITALVFFGLYQLGYLLAFVPYNAFIKYSASPERYGAVSGIGFGWGQLGSIAGLFLTLPIVHGSFSLLESDRLAPLLLATIAFAVFAVPSMIVFCLKRISPVQETAPPPAWWKTFWTHLLESRKYRQVFPFLLSFYFFSDAILTISLYSAIYLEKVFQIADSAKVIIFLLVLVGWGAGSLLAGSLADRLGHRRTLSCSLFWSGVFILAVALVSNERLLYPIFVLWGVASGAVYAASRSYLASLVPKEESGKFFGLYTFAERFASVIGPAVWGITIILFAGIAPVNYRIAAALMGLIALLGIIPLRNRIEGV